MSADNDLFNYADYNLTRLSIPEIYNPSVNIKIFCDGRYLKYGGESVAFINSFNEDGASIERGLGRVNSGSLSEVKKFLDYTQPAERSIVIFWGHSSGLPITAVQEGVSLGDETSGSKGLTFKELIEAAKYAKEKANRPIDLLGLDVCSMMSIEAVYALRDYAKYVGGSQDKQNAFSWDYKALVEYLNNNYFQKTKNLITHLVSSFGYFYDFEYHQIPVGNRNERSSNDTFSIIETSGLEAFRVDLFDFVKAIKNSFSTDALKKVLVGVVKKSRIDACTSQLDLIIFLENLKNAMDSNNISYDKSKLNKLIKDGKDLIFDSYNRQPDLTSGLSIRDAIPKTSKYYVHDFDPNNEWVSFLQPAADAFPTEYSVQRKIKRKKG